MEVMDDFLSEPKVEEPSVVTAEAEAVAGDGEEPALQVAAEPEAPELELPKPPAREPAPTAAPAAPPALVPPMGHLIKYFPSIGVTAEFRELAATWPLWESDEHPHEPPGSNRFHIAYHGDYDSERVLIMAGRATLTPDDGSPAYTVCAGDAVYFHKGFSCTWAVTEAPIQQHYGYFADDGKEIKEESIECDICGAECWKESYLFNDELDICPRCFRSDAQGAEEYEGAQFQKLGKPAKVAKKKRPSSSYTSKGGSGDKPSKAAKKLEAVKPEAPEAESAAE